MSWIADFVGGMQGGITGSYASHPFDIMSLAVVRGEAKNGVAAGIQRVKQEGVGGLWRGAWLNATFNAVNKSIYFFLYATLTGMYKRRFLTDVVSYQANLLIGYLSQLGSGASSAGSCTSYRGYVLKLLCGITVLTAPAVCISVSLSLCMSFRCAVPFNMPLYVIFMRSLAPQSSGKGAAELVRSLYAEGGVGRFWQGSWSWVGYAMRPAIEITVYDQIRARVVPAGAQLGGVNAFLLGALGRAIGTSE